MVHSRVERQRQKFEEEERHYQYLVAKGYTSATIADLLIHNMLEILKVGVGNQHPEFNEIEIFAHLREIISADKNLKKEFRGKRDG
jgi:hypothetical protein